MTLSKAATELLDRVRRGWRGEGAMVWHEDESYAVVEELVSSGVVARSVDTLIERNPERAAAAARDARIKDAAAEMLEVVAWCARPFNQEDFDRSREMCDKAREIITRIEGDT